MGCDIHAYAEVRRAGRWERQNVEVFDVRDYGLFGFLADVRNYSHSPVIAQPRGVPDDADLTAEDREEMADGWYHDASWLTLAELLAYDYEQVFWDRRITRETSPGSFNGAALAEEGEGKHLPLGEFLGAGYLRELDRLAELGHPTDVRIVFWFDN